MGKCDLQTVPIEAGNYRHTCQVCGKVTENASPNLHDFTCRGGITVVVNTNQGTCKHKGTEKSRRLCDTCQGRVQIKIFCCRIFEECTLEKRLPGTQCCGECPRFELVVIQ